MKKVFILLFIFSGVLFVECKNPLAEPPMEEQAPLAETEEANEMPDDFLTFYRQFHQDTAFQIAHITFPLEGIPANADTLTAPDNFRWQQNSWKWHRPIDPALTGYEQKYQVITQEMVIEKIIEKTSNIGMTRRFAKMDNEWMLIYYADMNPMP
ncbi:MAG: DUF4348 domain-containing protein [Saprospiraceae bacterium]|nr:DUF4348 domain-containing protein [Saprospiraceae bacterium]